MNDYQMYSNEYRQMQRERRRRIAIRQRLAFAGILLILITFIICILTVAAEARKFEEGQQVSDCTATPTEAQEQPTEVPDDALQTALYNIPLDDNLQRFVITVCDEYKIDPAIIFAVMYKESGYDAAAIGDGGDSLGLMQIQEKWHKERLERLGVTDLLNPYQNAAVGIDFLAELLMEYEGNPEMALMAFNAGRYGADEYWFSKGIYSNDYSAAVMAEAERMKGDGR